jgi:hypothetical protein
MKGNMRKEKQIRAKLRELEKYYEPVLKQPPSNIQINAPLALMQLEGETKIHALQWVLGEVGVTV